MTGIITGMPPTVSRLVLFIEKYYGCRRKFHKEIKIGGVGIALADEIIEAIRSLDIGKTPGNFKRNREIVLRYFGFYGDEIPENAGAVSTVMGLSANSVRVISAEALKKLRSSGFDKILKQFLIEDEGVST